MGKNIFDIDDELSLSDVNIEDNDYDLAFIVLIDDILEYENNPVEDDVYKINTGFNLIENYIDHIIFDECKLSDMKLFTWFNEGCKWKEIDGIEDTEFIDEHKTYLMMYKIKGNMTDREFDKFFKILFNILKSKVAIYTDLIVCEYEDDDPISYTDFFGSLEIYDWVTFANITVLDYFNQRNLKQMNKFRDIMVKGYRGDQLNDNSANYR